MSFRGSIVYLLVYKVYVRILYVSVYCLQRDRHLNEGKHIHTKRSGNVTIEFVLYANAPHFLCIQCTHKNLGYRCARIFMHAQEVWPITQLLCLLCHIGFLCVNEERQLYRKMFFSIENVSLIEHSFTLSLGLESFTFHFTDLCSAGGVKLRKPVAHLLFGQYAFFI